VGLTKTDDIKIHFMSQNTIRACENHYILQVKKLML